MGHLGRPVGGTGNDRIRIGRGKGREMACIGSSRRAEKVHD